MKNTIDPDFRAAIQAAHKPEGKPFVVIYVADFFGAPVLSERFYAREDHALRAAANVEAGTRPAGGVRVAGPNGWIK